MSKIIRHGNGGGFAYTYRECEGVDYNSHLHLCYEFLYVMDGVAVYNVEGTDYTVNPGDIIYTAPNEFHSFSFPKKCMYKRQFFHIYPSFIAPVKALIPDISGRKPGTGNLIPAALVNKYKLYDIFSGLEHMCGDPQEETEAMALAYAIQMLSMIHLIMRKEDLSMTGMRVGKNVVKMMNFIDEHYLENISLQDIASYMYMDKSYIGKLFKKHTGMTIKPYINMLRIVSAKNMILNGRQATEVYLECGFDNYSTFYRAFKKYVGFTPEEYKKHSGNEN